MTNVDGRRPRVISVVGTRPNFMKVAPVAALLRSEAGLDHVLVHTGQHYDDFMSRIFFLELGMPEPDVYLGAGSGTHSSQTARIMLDLERVFVDMRPDYVLVPGDVTSTLAAALAAKQAGTEVGHIEAGLRSFDREMPEELNRLLVDQMSDALFTHSPEAREHLLAEGRPPAAIHEVGNTMIDTLVALRGAIAARDAPATFDLPIGEYILVTLHRPALVDGPLLKSAVEALCHLADAFHVVFPVHPRTLNRLRESHSDLRLHPRLTLLEPLGYLDFLSLTESAAAVLTDSGGVQEETTFLGIPCFTLRANTERPITLDLGTNRLLGLDPRRIEDIPKLLTEKRNETARIPPGWDGHAGRRIVAVLNKLLEP